MGQDLPRSRILPPRWPETARGQPLSSLCPGVLQDANSTGIHSHIHRPDARRLIADQPATIAHAYHHEAVTDDARPLTHGPVNAHYLARVAPELATGAPGALLSSIVAAPLRRFTAIEHVSNVLFVVVHLSLLFVFVVPLSWKVAALASGGYALRMWAVTAGYHRYFAHRSYKTTRAFQLVLAVLGATTMQNGPIWWASVHRRHHKDSDGPHDIHSPVEHGFWYAHVGWVFDRTVPRPRDESNVTDLTGYPELRWVDDHDWLPVTVYAVACFAIGGLPGLVWGFVVSTLAVFHA